MSCNKSINTEIKSHRAEVQERSQKSSKEIGEVGALSWVEFKGGCQDQVFDHLSLAGQLVHKLSGRLNRGTEFCFVLFLWGRGEYSFGLAGAESCWSRP